MTTEAGRSLQAFGLSVDAEVAWKVLLRWPDLARAGLCERARLDEGRVELALDELRARGLVEPAPNALGVTAVDPRVALEHAVSVEQRDLAARLAVLADLRAQLPALAAEYAKGRQRVDSELPIEVVNGLEPTRNRIHQLSSAAQIETLSIQGVLLSRSARAAVSDLDLETLARGVAGRTLVHRDALADEEAFRYLGTLAAAGEQVRLADRLPPRLLMIDGEVAVIPLDANDPARGAIFVRVRTIVELCALLFEQVWATASPLFVVNAPGSPDGRAARVLELMAAGRKDETIARSLGVGVRTVRRDVAALMAELGEHTRASAVAAAIRRGWLSA